MEWADPMVSQDYDISLCCGAGDPLAHSGRQIAVHCLKLYQQHHRCNNNNNNNKRYTVQAVQNLDNDGREDAQGGGADYPLPQEEGGGKSMEIGRVSSIAPLLTLVT
eukprot:1159873-Pelagomonas_calceolata.AAC.11